MFAWNIALVRGGSFSCDFWKGRFIAVGSEKSLLGDLFVLRSKEASSIDYWLVGFLDRLFRGTTDLALPMEALVGFR